MYIPDHPCTVLIKWGTGSGNINVLLNVINYQPDIDKIYFCAKNQYEGKYQFSLLTKEKTHN